MWRRRKAQIEELDEKLELLDTKLVQVREATANLSRAAVAASAAEKSLRATVNRAEGTLGALKRASRGR